MNVFLCAQRVSVICTALLTASRCSCSKTVHLKFYSAEQYSTVWRVSAAGCEEAFPVGRSSADKSVDQPVANSLHTSWRSPMIVSAILTYANIVIAGKLTRIE